MGVVNKKKKLEYGSEFNYESSCIVHSIRLKTKRRCRICCLKIQPKNMVILSDGCRHEMCKSCLEKTLECHLERNSDDPLNIECLWCNNLISASLIQEIVGHDKNAIANFKQKKLNNIHWECPRCYQLIFSHNNNNSLDTSSFMSNDFQVLCKNCSYLLCTTCNGTHRGGTCRDYLQGNDEGLRTYMWKLQKTKRCPRCFVFIEKGGGCSYMNCFRCGYEFCFDCLKQYKNFHHCDSEMIFFKLLFMLFSVIGSFYIIYTLKQLSKTFKD